MFEGAERQQMMAGVFEDALEEEGFSPEGFEVLEELDRGGMAVVYRARQWEPTREVALKVVLPRFAGEEDILERFQREGRAMAALEHPGILPVYQVGEWDGLAFIAMKLATGGSLQSLLMERSPEIREVTDWMIAAGEAVHFAHQHGVLHRDLKPGNLLFDKEGEIYVGDFGVAKLEFARDGGLTRTESLVGTPHYLAPEVASGDAGGGSVVTDLYGLGTMLYECLTGRRPHEGAGNLAAQLRAVVEEELVPVRKHRPKVPRDLGVICEKALAKDPGDRYRTVADFVEDLRRWRSGREILARPAGLVERTWRLTKRYPLTAALAMSLVLMAGTGGALLFENYKRRGEMLRESFVERAKMERLSRFPGFRSRALNLLEKAGNLRNSERLREEAVAVFAYWDVSNEGDVWESAHHAGDFSALEVEGGVRVGTGEGDWFLPGGVLRCAPAWSSEGRFLAMVRGERMELVIYDVSRRKEFAALPLRGWPDRLEFSDRGERLKIVFAEGEATLVSVRGEVLLDGFSKNDGLREPVGFTVWSGQYLTPVEANPYGGQLSESGVLLVTTSAVGIQIWDVEKRCAVGFYEVENQRIDAPTDAWWLEDDRLLVQVPGAKEILKIGPGGEVLGVETFVRVPGSKVMSVLDNGDWLVEIRDEDGASDLMVWPGGDSEMAERWHAAPPIKMSAREGRLIQYENWILTLPDGGEALKIFPLSGRGRVIVLTKDYRICDWDLNVLADELAKSGL